MMQSEGPVRRMAATPRWVWALLVLSLAGNLAIAGVIGGVNLRKMSEPGLDRVESRIVAILPEARRDEARMILKDDAQERDAWLARLRETGERVIAAARAEPYDAEAMVAALSARRAVHAERFERRGAEIVELLGVLDRNERVALAEAFERRMERRQARLSD